MSTVPEGHGALREARERPLELILLPAGILLLAALLTGLPQLAQDDPSMYFDWVGRLLGGQLPYRDFQIEYPPLAFIAWLLPRLVSGNDLNGFTGVLAVQNMACAVVISVSLVALAERSWSSGPTSRALGILAFAMVGVASVAAWRYDLFAAALTAVGLVLASRQRYASAGFVLALGTLAKIFPAAVFAVLLLMLLGCGRRRAAAASTAAFALTIAAVMVPVLLLAGTDGLSFLTYQQDRGLQLESVGAGLVMLVHAVGGPPATLEHAFGAWQIASPLAGSVVAAEPLLLVGLMLAVLASGFARFRQEWRELGRVEVSTAVAYATAALLVTIVANKVLSPQYLVWLLPVVPLLPRPQAIAGIGAFLLTLVIYPQAYGGLMAQQLDMVLVLNARNGLLVGLLLWTWLGHLPHVTPAQPRQLPSTSG